MDEYDDSYLMDESDDWFDREDEELADDFEEDPNFTVYVNPNTLIEDPSYD